MAPAACVHAVSVSTFGDQAKAAALISARPRGCLVIVGRERKVVSLGTTFLCRRPEDWP
jgi:hypothetical protein